MPTAAVTSMFLDGWGVGGTASASHITMQGVDDQTITMQGVDDQTVALVGGANN